MNKSLIYNSFNDHKHDYSLSLGHLSSYHTAQTKFKALSSAVGCTVTVQFPTTGGPDVI